MHICPVRVIEEYTKAAVAIGWDLAYGFSFTPTNSDGSRVVGALKAGQMTGSLQTYKRCARVPPPGDNTQYTMHSFRVGGARRSRSFAGTVIADIMSLVGWKSAGVAERYVGATPLHHGDKRKRESHEQAYMDANELPTLPEFAKR